MSQRLDVVGYELEVRPCRGLWSRYEGRVMQLVQSSGADKPYRNHYLPDYGPAAGRGGWVKSQPYWARSRSRERLERKLRNTLNKRLAQKRATEPERVSLAETMAGWE